MRRKIDHLLRVLVSAICFSTFGVGGLSIVLAVIPLINVISFSAATRKRRIRWTIHLSFYLFVWLMERLGAVKVEREGMRELRKARKCILVANHPSLVDIVILISCLPNADCIIKSKLLNNPFFGPLVRAAYIPNSADAAILLAACQKSLETDSVLVIFPEGTRTPPGQPIKLSRGAANIALRTNNNILPVHISCTPPGLLRDQKWYLLPVETLHFKLKVSPLLEVQDYLQNDTPYSIAARRLTADIEKILFPGVTD
jgi:1-acyl-sn-glycerol-3-phosphate acyltransferase